MPGISDSLLQNLSDENTINLLTSWYSYQHSIYVNFVIEGMLDMQISVFDKQVRKDTEKVSHLNSEWFGRICHREYELKNNDSVIDFQKLVDLKNIHDNLGMMLMKLKSDDYFERTVSQMIFNVLDYL